MADTPETSSMFNHQQTWLDEISQMALRETPRELAELDAFEAKLTRTSPVVKAMRRRILTQPEEVIDLDAVNDEEILKQRDELAEFDHEFTTEVGAVAIRAKQSQQAGTPVSEPVGERTVAWPAMPAQVDSDLSAADIELAHFIHDTPVPQLTTYEAELTESTPPHTTTSRKGFLGRFRRQKPVESLVVRPTIERAPRRRLGRAIAATALAGTVLIAGFIGVNRLTSTTVTSETTTDIMPSEAVASSLELQPDATTMDVKDRLGSLLMTERHVRVEPIDFEATQAEARAIITVASMQAEYGAQNVQALFANLPE